MHYCRCKELILFANTFPKDLNGKAPHHKFDTFTHVKGLLYKHVMDAGKKFLTLVIPKSWKYTFLVEAHDKLGHQGNSHTYCLIKCQYYWKGMNKDIRKYIANCVLCRWDKAKVQQYPLQMTEIPHKPFDKIAIDLVTDCKLSTSDNKHILTIIDHLTGWPEAFPIPDKSTDTIVTTLINQYLPVHMCPRYILSDNSMEFKNSLMDQVLQQLGIDRTFSAPYHPQSNSKLEVFHKYLKPILKKLCEKDPANWDKYINQVLVSYRITPNLATAESPFFLVYGRDPNLPLHQLLEHIQHFLRDPDSGKLQLETHRLALVIAKQTLDENRFIATQKTLTRNNPAFQVGDHVYIKNKQPGKWDLKWRPGYQIVHIEHKGHFIHIKNQATGRTRSCNITDIILEPPLSSGILTLSSEGPANILIILLIYLPYNLQILHKQYHYAISHSSSYCIINNCHLHYSLVLTLTPTMNSSQMKLGKLVIFQPVL